MIIPVSIYRVGNWFHKRGFKLCAKLATYCNRFLFSVWIPSSASLGKNFRLGYWGLGVVIHSNAVIGDNCLVAQNVTIGRNFGDQNVPIIGNDVYIGPGSVVFGEIVVGNNVIIGANSVINKSVPDNCTVAGNPMRILQRDRIEKYYNLN